MKAFDSAGGVAGIAAASRVFIPIVIAVVRGVGVGTIGGKGGPADKLDLDVLVRSTLGARETPFGANAGWWRGTVGEYDHYRPPLTRFSSSLIQSQAWT